ncbi:TPA: hypothetical protein DCZ15_03180 [Candidatus Falkowbacteria bacterium]|nr:MAG: hypothetical protein UV95_C0002G0022 [Candidatus Falkowbacteria bacterium GW2011_GWF2_43_32]HBA36852.1 hypothetical protein [Candidatus Falkowbacteria bacterium]
MLKDPTFEQKEEKYRRIESDVPSFENEKKEIEITLEPDGKPKALAFFDIDSTLGNFKDIHGKAIQELYPNHDPEEVAQEFFKGQSLGTTYRVHDRLIKIFDDGLEEFKDVDRYMKWFSEHVSEIDKEGGAHEKASAYSFKHSQLAAGMAENLYQKDPSYFEKAKIVPVFKLVKLYKRMGIPMTVMTANDKPFAESICKCLNLSDSFITLAYQQDFEGGGKDRAMEVLLDKIKEKNVPIPEKLIVVGDSLNGDIGPGAAFQNRHNDFEVAGVLISDGNLEDDRLKIAENKDLKNINVEVLDSSKVTEDAVGEPQIALFRKKYQTKND